MSSSLHSGPKSNMLTADQQLVTQRCMTRIQAVISEKGEIGFDEYMQLALHDSEVGYYCQQDEIFGKDGDFTTVPETSVHLAFCLAHACAKLIRDDVQRCVLEIGAGSGKFACDLLEYLKIWGMLPGRYYIYEPSEALRAKQRELLTQELPEYVEQVEWLTDLSHNIETVIIIANEVLDALPVNCIEVGPQKIYERCVTISQENELVWMLKEPTEKLDAAIDFITVMLDEPLAEGYQSEINLQVEPTLSSWASSCEQCVMFLIDYGYPRHEYYHPQRHMGTLRSYFKHQVSEDVFINPGLQDITADVDFSAVARMASYISMGVLSFSSQRNFMLANNLLDWQPSADTEVERIAQIAQLKQLTLGSAISERFQVMVLGKGIDYGADRFTMRDMRTRL
ncbi:MAG: SAM-dependent methyltransferase [Gammaproteobacteria bacterium]|nr:MAG: SAM-dependent methyltransferase [Gammaproteobacteria bacterium]